MVTLRQRTLWIALVLIIIQLCIRGYVAWSGYFYWDDLILIGQASTHRLDSLFYLFNDHDGHLMPGAFFLAWIIIHSWPLQWIGPVICLLILQSFVSIALLRALWVISGPRPGTIVVLIFGLFSPMGIPAFAWWSAGLNALPMNAALSWICADIVCLLRTRQQRYAVSALGVYLISLMFFEKSLIIPLIVFLLVTAFYRVRGYSWSTIGALLWNRSKSVWITFTLVTGIWIGIYVIVVNQHRWSTNIHMALQLLVRSFTHGIIPALVGGPWSWSRWSPASPWALPGHLVMGLGWISLIVVLVLSLRYRSHSGIVWGIGLCYALACQLPIYLMRSSPFTALELAQTLRYVADLVIVLTLLGAIGLNCPYRSIKDTQTLHWIYRCWVIIVVPSFVVSSLYSTVTFVEKWRQDPTRTYLPNVQHGLSIAHHKSSSPLLDQDVDPLILGPITAPENRLSHLFALISDRPKFGDSTDQLWTFDSVGHLHSGKLFPVRMINLGPQADCGYLIQPDHLVQMSLNGPLLPQQWTIELNYLATTDGSLHLAFEQGPWVSIPIQAGLHQRFIRLAGAGEMLMAQVYTAALSVCIAMSPIGYVIPQ